MNEIFTALIQFPTVILSTLMCFVLLYWLSVIVGALDLHFLDSALHSVDGAADSALDAADGAAHAHHGAADHAGSASILAAGGVPLTIGLSIWIFLAWAISFGCELFLNPRGWLWSALLFLSALAIGLLAMRQIIKPLARIFHTAKATSNPDLVGKLCEVTTGQVTAVFGQARCDDATGDHLIQVRHDKPDTFKRNDRALIIDYDADRQAFLIEPIDPSMRDL
jgi:hypothetical protein